MKKGVRLAILVAVAARIAIAAPALAADMAVKAQPPTATAPAYSWTGLYIGGNGGYGWKDPTVTFTGNDVLSNAITCGGGFGGTCVPAASFGMSGRLGGLQAGYNWQANQNLLVGVEADFDWSNIRGSGSSNVPLPGAGGVNLNFQASQSIQWFGTVRGRVGVLPANNLLLFATGGFAYGRVDENVALNTGFTGTFVGAFAFSCNFPGGAGATNCFVGNSSRTATGFTVGAGGEYALWNNFSLKAEYLYVNLGHGNAVNLVAQSTGGLAPNPSSFSAAYSKVDFNVVRGGLNYKF
jgi:outer membrane immunogenic protein